MNNWIDSGGDSPRGWTDDSREGESPQHRSGCWRAALIAGFAILLVGLAQRPGHARDHGQFANASPELRAWFNALKSGKGPCCSDADGSAISDADWESGNGHYRVRIDGAWVGVPDEAVITEPNRVGRTMVWPIRDGVGGLYIRCFMPGSMT